MPEIETVSLTGLGSQRGTEDASLVAEQLVVPRKGEASAAQIGAKELAIGGGSGGAIVVLSNMFVHSDQTRLFIQVLAPTAAPVLTAAYQWMGGEIADWHDDWKSERKRLKLLKQAKSALEEARRQNADIDKDPKATAAHKVNSRETLQKIERKVLELSVKGILILE